MAALPLSINLGDLQAHCPTCQKLQVVESAAILGGKVILTCGECHAKLQLASAEQAASPALTTPSAEVRNAATVCPKCSAPVNSGLSACARCGLVTEKFSTFHQQGLGASAELTALWDACEQEWNNNARHEALVEMASAQNQFAWVAGKYRRILATRSDDAMADEMIRRIQRMVEVVALRPTKKDEKQDAPYKKTLLLIVGLVFMATALAVATTMFFSKKTPGEPSLQPRVLENPSTPRPNKSIKP